MSKRDIVYLDIEKFLILDSMLIHGYFVTGNYLEIT